MDKTIGGIFFAKQLKCNVASIIMKANKINYR